MQITDYNQIRNLVADNQTLTAIDLLLLSINPKEEEYNNLILLKGQYKNAKNQESMGIISFSDALRSQTHVSYAVLNLLKSLETKPQQVNSGANPSPKDDKETILFLASDSDGRLELEKEFVQIGIGLQQDLTEHYKLFSAWAVTTDSFQTEILNRKPNILHFAGHGKREGIYLQSSTGEDKFVPSTAITNFFKIFAKRFPMKCVFLNACYSEKQAEAISKHVKYVIGMSSAVENLTAIKFSTAFYRTYANELDMEFAFDLAVNAIQMDTDLEDADAPVIYIDGVKRVL